MSTVYFCTERSFPRGDAGANRILHMAKALLLAGWDVKVYSMGHAKKEHWSGTLQEYVYDGVRYETVPEYPGGKLGRIVRRLSAGSCCRDFLEKEKLSAGDAVIVYSSNYTFCKAVQDYVSNIRGVKIIYDVVEWHQAFQFTSFRTRYIYHSFKRCFEKLYPSTGYVIAISRRLKEHFESKGCTVLKLPVYITPDEYMSSGSVENGRLNLIYPGNPYKKDSLEVMLGALNLLDSEERKNVVLHLTGTNLSLLKLGIPGKEWLLDALIDEGLVHVHEWMEYDELMELYDSIDFALIARPDNIVTQSNFPSKVPELMNRGIPAIITPVGDVAEYLTDGKDAVFVETCEAQSCTDAIRRCLNMTNEEIRAMHLQAKKTAVDRFDYRNSAAMLAAFLMD